ncbi:Uncharacterized protein DAT39_006667 [Clarias magur]|uniref:Uncharacterized protein n=1 Tax=Clarias magur TaxID=1594786 RepID=A0A8J4UU14_CLAMG|nr:Uncharacterized protein DAT39_006667 [Clarias magur]
MICVAVSSQEGDCSTQTRFFKQVEDHLLSNCLKQNLYLMYLDTRKYVSLD